MIAQISEIPLVNLLHCVCCQNAVNFLKLATFDNWWHRHNCGMKLLFQKDFKSNNFETKQLILNFTHTNVWTNLNFFIEFLVFKFNKTFVVINFLSKLIFQINCISIKRNNNSKHFHVTTYSIINIKNKLRKLIF